MWFNFILIGQVWSSIQCNKKAILDQISQNNENAANWRLMSLQFSLNEGRFGNPRDVFNFQLGKQGIKLALAEATKFKYFINLTNGEKGPNKSF